MKKSLIFSILLISITLTITAQETVAWLTKYDEALAAAERESKNIFVLITAPDWCIWCTRLEENVLSKPEFQRYLSGNFIPLKLLDKVDGKRNPELSYFDFSGYPTVYLYDREGHFIRNIYTQDPGEMLASMAKYRDAEGKFRPLLKDLKLPDKYTFSDDGGGEYFNRGDGTWSYKSGDELIEYKQVRYDFDYLYLEHPTQEHVIALPMNGSDRHMANLVDEKWVWSDLSDVERVGGDPYFD